MPYSPLLVKPMREELTVLDVKELLTSGDVDAFMNDAKKGTTLVVINAVTGVAAGFARPGLRQALESAKVRPDRMGSVFADQDLEATARMRSYFADIPPSEPAFAYFSDGELVFFMPRHRIEGRDASQVANELSTAFEEHDS